MRNTERLVNALKHTSVLFVETPIIFTKDYNELIEPSGILKVILAAESKIKNRQFTLLFKINSNS